MEEKHQYEYATNSVFFCLDVARILIDHCFFRISSKDALASCLTALAQIYISISHSLFKECTGKEFGTLSINNKDSNLSIIKTCFLKNDAGSVKQFQASSIGHATINDTIIYGDYCCNSKCRFFFNVKYATSNYDRNNATYHEMHEEWLVKISTNFFRL